MLSSLQKPELMFESFLHIMFRLKPDKSQWQCEESWGLLYECDSTTCRKQTWSRLHTFLTSCMKTGDFIWSCCDSVTLLLTWLCVNVRMDALMCVYMCVFVFKGSVCVYTSCLFTGSDWRHQSLKTPNKYKVSIISVVFIKHLLLGSGGWGVVCVCVCSRWHNNTINTTWWCFSSLDAAERDERRMFWSHAHIRFK